MNHLNLEEFERKIAYTFSDKNLLILALTHSSYANETKKGSHENNERLEFLGDSVLSIVVSEFLFHKYPDLPEGELTKLRASMVCEKALHVFAREIHLGEFLLLGKGEEHTGGRERPSILADMVESIIAALYLDSGIDEARRFIMANVLAGAELGEAHHIADYKTELQELVQRRSNQVISYELIGESGPDHNKLFTFRVLINGVPTGEGSGRSKKEAEQMAAKDALEALDKR